MLPTLLVKGNLSPTIPKTDKRYNETLEELNKHIPIEFVISWIKGRYPGIGRPDDDTPTIADRVLILRSKTGSGKSSTLPPILYKNFIYGTDNEKKKPSIVCTQPRVVTAKELAIEASEKSYYVPLVLGENIGYQTGSLTEKAKYGITYCTIGVLLQQLRMRDDELILRKYKFIILDEVHERSTDMDQVFYLLKAFMSRVLPDKRAPFIILTSATFDPPVYAKFFGVYNDEPELIFSNGSFLSKNNNQESNKNPGLRPVEHLDEAKNEPSQDVRGSKKIYGQNNVIDVEGFAFPVAFNWLDKTSTNYAMDMAKIVLKIHKENKNDNPKSCDILIFVPGAMNMDTVIMAVKKYCQQNNEEVPKDLLILKLESTAVESRSRDYTLTMEKYDKLPAGITRRLILSTNVAETGLTIESLKYVLDFGYNKATEYNPECGISELLEKPAPKSRILQRKGRAGRKNPGEFYPIYTEETYNLLPDIQLPAILESDFTDMLMNIAAINQEFSIVEDIIEKMLDVPSPQCLCVAISKLTFLGLIEPLPKNNDKNEPNKKDLNNRSSEAPGFGPVEHFDKATKEPRQNVRGSNKIPGLIGSLSSAQRSDGNSNKVGISRPVESPDDFRNENHQEIRGSNKDFKITDLGNIAAKFSKMRIETARMILNGYVKYPPMPTLNSNNEISYVNPKVAVIDLITLAAIIENKSELMRNMKIDKLNILLKKGTPKWFCEDANLAKVWDMCQDELIIYLFVFNSVIVALSSGDAPHEWAEENNLNINTFSSIAQTRNNIIDNMINIGLDINHNFKYSVISDDNTPAEFIEGIKRAIRSGFIFNTMKLVDENTRPRYIQKYVHSRSEGINSFKLRFEDAISDYAKEKGIFPDEVVPIKIGMQQMHNPTGFSEMMPVIKSISVII